MVNYKIGDFLIQIKNAVRADNRSVTTRQSKLVTAVANVLKKEGILSKVSTKDGKISVEVAYHKKEPVLMDLKIVSKPGLRQYMSVEEMKSRKRAHSTFLVVSTPKGVMSSGDAIKNNLGGEVIAEIL